MRVFLSAIYFRFVCIDLFALRSEDSDVSPSRIYHKGSCHDFFSFMTLFGEGKMSWMPRWWEPSQQLSYSFFIQVINISSFSSGVDVVCENWHGTDVVVVLFSPFCGFGGWGYVMSRPPVVLTGRCGPGANGKSMIFGINDDHQAQPWLS